MLFNADKTPQNVGSFLSEPTEVVDTAFVRDNCQYENRSDRFRLKSRNFVRQYAHMYAERLWSMRNKVVEAAKSKWGKL
jgi:DNA polymerase delta subunit 2